MHHTAKATTPASVAIGHKTRTATSPNQLMTALSNPARSARVGDCRRNTKSAAISHTHTIPNGTSVSSAQIPAICQSCQQLQTPAAGNANNDTIPGIQKYRGRSRESTREIHPVGNGRCLPDSAHPRLLHRPSVSPPVTFTLSKIHSFPKKDAALSAMTSSCPASAMIVASTRQAFSCQPDRNSTRMEICPTLSWHPCNQQSQCPIVHNS